MRPTPEKLDPPDAVERVASISHDLGTQLFTLRLLLNQLASSATPNQRELLGLVKSVLGAHSASVEELISLMGGAAAATAPARAAGS